MAAGRRRWWALGALAVSSLVVGLDLTVLNLALPTLAVSLHITSGDPLQWFVVSYSLVFAAMLLPAGLLGDRFGRKRLLIVALVVFGVASLACATLSRTTYMAVAALANSSCDPAMRGRRLESSMPVDGFATSRVALSCAATGQAPAMAARHANAATDCRTVPTILSSDVRWG